MINGLNLRTASHPNEKFSFGRLAVVTMSLHGNRNPKTDVGTRDWDVTVMGLIMLLFGGMWTLVLWVTKAAGCFKYCSMDHTSRSVEDDGADNDLNHLGFDIRDRKSVV